jgi:hypothetical protein
MGNIGSCQPAIRAIQYSAPYEANGWKLGSYAIVEISKGKAGRLQSIMVNLKAVTHGQLMTEMEVW